MCALHQGVQRSCEESSPEKFAGRELDAHTSMKKMENFVVDVKEPIRVFILEYAAGRGVTEVKDDDSLLKNNVIDSLGVFRLIAFLEETFPLTVEDSDMVPENFQSLNDIGSFVAGKLGKADGETGPYTHGPLPSAS
jgi:acyl carrier protein